MTDISKLQGYKLALAIHALTNAHEALMRADQSLSDSRLQDLIEEVRKDTVTAIELYSAVIERRE